MVSRTQVAFYNMYSIYMNVGLYELLNSSGAFKMKKNKYNKTQYLEAPTVWL